MLHDNALATPGMPQHPALLLAATTRLLIGAPVRSSPPGVSRPLIIPEDVLLRRPPQIASHVKENERCPWVWQLSTVSDGWKHTRYRDYGSGGMAAVSQSHWEGRAAGRRGLLDDPHRRYLQAGNLTNYHPEAQWDLKKLPSLFHSFRSKGS